MSDRRTDTNTIGLTRTDYRGKRSTLCPGCGHNTISAQIITACYEMNIDPHEIVKFSGIGCSSKSPTYFLGQSFGFNGLHGRMPSMALGAAFANTGMKVLGISGDGDTASIGLGQFKHLIRRNLPMVYIVENNGVYGLTKGQFSATAEKGLALKRQGENPFLPIDIAKEALIGNASFVARSFAGDPKQLRELLKAAFSHRGTSVLDVISPCVSFNNREDTLHSYQWGRQHQAPLHDIAYVPTRRAIILEEFNEGEIKEVTLHDGSLVVLKKLEHDYDPTDKWQALRMLEEAEKNRWLLTGLIYIDPNQHTLYDYLDLTDEPLNRMSADRLRPSPETLQQINQSML
ncbi:MAG: 2-oxoacid:ferredoxin oxidoreductase subunit beta [Chloroflexota bacterium]|nr:2-oxoacid:ferredoxin oxidoreductase subunit beta [Chloroflexota bacterium]